MKKYFTITIILLQFGAFAQKYQAIDSTLVWSTEQWEKQSCYVVTQSQFYTKGYELNNGRAWLKVYKSYYSYSFGPTCPPAVPWIYNQFDSYVWNDTINKRVYKTFTLTPSFNPAASNLLYDFNKGIGDTIVLNPLFGSFLSGFKLPITNVDSILFAGKYHRRLITDCIPGILQLNNTKATFMEGVGSSLGGKLYGVRLGA